MTKITVSDANSDDRCDECDEPATFRLEGAYDCHECGQVINLCEKHETELFAALQTRWQERLTKATKAQPGAIYIPDIVAAAEALGIPLVNIPLSTCDGPIDLRGKDTDQ